MLPYRRFRYAQNCVLSGQVVILRYFGRAKMFALGGCALCDNQPCEIVSAGSVNQRGRVVAVVLES